VCVVCRVALSVCLSVRLVKQCVSQPPATPSNKAKSIDCHATEYDVAAGQQIVVTDCTEALDGHSSNHLKESAGERRRGA